MIKSICEAAYKFVFLSEAVSFYNGLCRDSPRQSFQVICLDHMGLPFLWIENG